MNKKPVCGSSGRLLGLPPSTRRVPATRAACSVGFPARCNQFHVCHFVPKCARNATFKNVWPRIGTFYFPSSLDMPGACAGTTNSPVGSIWSFSGSFPWQTDLGSVRRRKEPSGSCSHFTSGFRTRCLLVICNEGLRANITPTLSSEP